MSEAPTSTERTTFYDELVRRRRAAWIVASVCALVAAGVGLVLSAIVTPIVLLALGGLLKLVALLGVGDSLSQGGVALIRNFVAGQLANFDRLSAALDRVNGPGDLALLFSGDSARAFYRRTKLWLDRVMGGVLAMLGMRLVLSDH